MKSKDKVFNRIEAHRAAYKEFGKRLRAFEDQAGSTAAKQAFELADRAERRTFAALLRCKPTTPEGIRKLCNYLGTHWASDPTGAADRADTLTVLKTLAATVDRIAA